MRAFLAALCACVALTGCLSGSSAEVAPATRSAGSAASSSAESAPSARATSKPAPTRAPAQVPPARTAAPNPTDPAAPNATSGGTPLTVTATQGPPVALRVYFPRMDSQGQVTLVQVERTVAGGQDLALAAVGSFIAGPSGAERSTNVGIALHRGTPLRAVELRDGTLIVDFGTEVQRLAGTPWVEAVYWSLVLTLFEVPEVQHVELRIEGQPLTRLGSPPFSIPSDPRPEAVPFAVQPWEGDRS